MCIYKHVYTHKMRCGHPGLRVWRILLNVLGSRVLGFGFGGAGFVFWAEVKSRIGFRAQFMSRRFRA